VSYVAEGCFFQVCLKDTPERNKATLDNYGFSQPKNNKIQAYFEKCLALEGEESEESII
jgi:hypothetical protein